MIAAFPARSICFALTLAMLAGCGGVAPPTASQPSESLNAVQSHDLLYLADRENNVYVYSYPQVSLRQTLAHLTPGGLCADEAGNVFIGNWEKKIILEYAHGGKSPIARLDDPGESPTACSVDSRTGNLAVTNAGFAGISIYKQGRGTPTIYNYHRFGFANGSYDNAGNLYVDGFGARGFALLRLPYGGSTFVKITLDRKIRYPGGVQWDGKHLAITSIGLRGKPSELYRFAIQGNTGTAVGKAPLLTSVNVTEFWIDGNALIGADNHGESGSAFKTWRYPLGGMPLETLSGFFQPVAAAVSKAR
jgi:hypothetical protein